jgi:hypothetical protein
MAVSIDSYITLTDAIVVDAGQLVDDSHTERRERAGRAIPGIGRHSMRAATPPYGGRPLLRCPRYRVSTPELRVAQSAGSIFYRLSTVPLILHTAAALAATNEARLRGLARGSRWIWRRGLHGQRHPDALGNTLADPGQRRVARVATCHWPHWSLFSGARLSWRISHDVV